MNKKKLFEDFAKCRERVAEIKAKVEAEKRAMTQEESAEVSQLASDMALLRAQMLALDGATPDKAVRTLSNAEQMWQDCYSRRQPMTVKVVRSIMDTTIHDEDGLIPISEQDFIKPLREGLIWDKMGISIQHGLSGTLRWPLHTKAVATWEDETSKLADSKIDFSKLTMNGSRLGIAIPVSKVELNDTQGRVESVIREEMPKSIIDAINSAVLTLSAEHLVDDGTNKTWKAKKQAGPFAYTMTRSGASTAYTYAIKDSANCQKKTLAASTPTRKELLEMMALVYGKGIERKNPGYAMNMTTKVALMDTKVDAGSGRFVCENDMILGMPVFTSNEIPDGVVLFADWSYLAAGFFGETSVVVDPYTLARQFSTDFVLNMRFGMAPLRKEAFVLGITSAAETALETSMKTDYAKATA